VHDGVEDAAGVAGGGQLAGDVDQGRQLGLTFLAGVHPGADPEREVAGGLVRSGRPRELAARRVLRQQA
jgi:hypothetical protein